MIKFVMNFGEEATFEPECKLLQYFCHFIHDGSRCVRKTVFEGVVSGKDIGVASYACDMENGRVVLNFFWECRSN